MSKSKKTKSKKNKCTPCNGTGEVHAYPPVFDIVLGDFIKIECKACDGSGTSNDDD